MDTQVGMAAPAESYPVRFDVEYPERLSRLLIFVKWLLALPHYFVLYVLYFVAWVLVIIAFFAILFTKTFPRGMFNFVVNTFRWNANVSAYIGLLRDEYPPFSWEPGRYPVHYEVDYPQQLSRWLPFVKWLLATPHYFAIVVLGLIAAVINVIAFFAILFTGRFPRGMFDFVVGVQRWAQRLNAYLYLLRDEYPPFSLK
jgi:hypothetical protein